MVGLRTTPQKSFFVQTPLERALNVWQMVALNSHQLVSVLTADSIVGVLNGAKQNGFLVGLIRS